MDELAEKANEGELHEGDSSTPPSAGKRKAGEKLATLEATKMQTSVYAATDGVMGEVLAGVGSSVEAGDLIVRLRG